MNSYAIAMTPCGAMCEAFDAARLWLRAGFDYALERRLVVQIENEFDMLATGALTSELE